MSKTNDEVLLEKRREKYTLIAFNGILRGASISEVTDNQLMITTLSIRLADDLIKKLDED